jgi:hypothetical protein
MAFLKQAHRKTNSLSKALRGKHQLSKVGRRGHGLTKKLEKAQQTCRVS